MPGIVTHVPNPRIWQKHWERGRGQRAEGQGAEGKGEEGQKQRQEELC